MMKPFECSRCGSKDFIIETIDDGMDYIHEVLCKNCMLLQGCLEEYTLDEAA